MAHGPGHRAGVDAKAKGLGVAGGAGSLPRPAQCHSEEPPRRIYGGTKQPLTAWFNPGLARGWHQAAASDRASPLLARLLLSYSQRCGRQLSTNARQVAA